MGAPPVLFRPGRASCGPGARLFEAPAMLAYIIRRVFQSAIVLLVVGLVAFAMFRFVGDPVDNMLGQERTQADIERLRAELGLDQNFLVQYWNFLEQAAQGNFGLSYRQGRPVAEILWNGCPRRWNWPLCPAFWRWRAASHLASSPRSEGGGYRPT
jgi:ABC-type microcin C transport system permease subunit YejB